MKRRDLEHVIRAAASIADDPEIIVIGSQAVLGSIPDAPASLLMSAEADVVPKNWPERAELIGAQVRFRAPLSGNSWFYFWNYRKEYRHPQ